MKHNVPIQSLIDHIKTAIDVDPWAKEMVEELLKEQEHRDKMFHALEDDWKRLKELLKEQEAVVRCKDCKHRPIKTDDDDLEFPDAKCPCKNPDDDWYSWYPADNWFCGNGERK